LAVSLFFVFVVVLFCTKPALHLSPSHRKDFRKPHVSHLASDKEQFRRKKGEPLRRFADDKGKPKAKLNDPLGKYNSKRDPLGKYKNVELARKKVPLGRDVRNRPGRPEDANRQPGKKPPPRDAFRKKDPADPKGKYGNGKPGVDREMKPEGRWQDRREMPPGMNERGWRDGKGADRKKPKKPAFEHSGDYRDLPMRKPEKPRKKEKGRDFDEQARKRSYDENMKKKKKPPVKGDKPRMKEKPKGKGGKPMKKKMPTKKGEHPDKEKVRKAMERGLKEKHMRKIQAEKGSQKKQKPSPEKSSQKKKKPSPEKMKKGGKPPLKRKKAVDPMSK